MKKLLLSAILFATSISFAYANKEGDQEFQLVSKITNMVKVDKIINALQLNGEANVWVTIDENKILHVESVESENFLTTFYIKQTLNGKQVDVDDSMIGKTIAVEVNFVQSN